MFHFLFVVPDTHKQAWEACCNTLPVHCAETIHLALADGERGYDVLCSPTCYEEVWQVWALNGWLHWLRETHPKAPQFMLVFETAEQDQVERVDDLTIQLRAHYGSDAVTANAVQLGSVTRHYLELDRVPSHDEMDWLLCLLAPFMATTLRWWYWPSHHFPLQIV